MRLPYYFTFPRVQVKFPLLKLPSLALREVLVCMDPTELIFFALLSKLCRMLVKEHLKTSQKRTLSMDISDYGIEIYRSYGDNTCVKKIWDLTHEGSNFDNSNAKAMIENVPVFRPQHIYWPCSYVNFFRSDIRESTDTVLRFLNELFSSCPINEVRLYPDDMYPFEKRSSLNFGKRCERLFIEGKQPMEFDELWNVLEGYTVMEYLQINVPITGDVSTNIPNWSRPKAMQVVRDSEWISSDIISSLNCATLTIINCKLTANDCRQFVNRWINSNERHLKFLCLHWDDHSPGVLNYDSFNVDLPLQAYDNEKRAEAFPYLMDMAMNCTNGKDILRKDGLLATIGINEPWQFFFCVWHDRFPSLDGLQIE